jgi:hypothetical protein
MGTAADLMGLSLPGPLAANLALTPQTLVTAGTSAGTATTIKADNHFVKLDTASSQTGAIFAADMPLGVPFVIFNPDSDSGVLYPMSGATINAASSLTIAQNKAVIVVRFSTTLLCSILTA